MFTIQIEDGREPIKENVCYNHLKFHHIGLVHFKETILKKIIYNQQIIVL